MEGQCAVKWEVWVMTDDGWHLYSVTTWELAVRLEYKLAAQNKIVRVRPRGEVDGQD